MDMDLPIVDILTSVAEPYLAEPNGTPNAQTIYCDRAQLEWDIECYAPGYLALEAAGKSGEYGMSCLTEPDKIRFDRKPRKRWRISRLVDVVRCRVTGDDALAWSFYFLP
ncbi:hypothetical protein N7448_007319 [Penicillium atrosanguineum]|uniref:uncharacterized protein n=1 Tax=Penicillium atrosanguineum TaxID=1132637 RepID=UPI0023831579|nr:uncharacterized protein N7443_001651 [Penicillium atrosanguineum]KAJ5126540.1 hypothetical protein N7448_007319 [Penicillium atrosanguineum]KAJ5146743.1 hypothetical protein N7526_000095 [Penicillium atrosanguineum]KAJ5314767.1 hypothetical protein N7443_001651 [Penicillium atrosanguineum]